jgi:cytochrome P450
MNLPSNNSRTPPGPDTPQPLGIDPQTLAVLQELQADYGNFVAMVKPNGRRAFFVNDADEVRKLLVRQHGKYVKGPGFERVKMLLGNGLIVSDGDTWRRSRTMIQPAFSRQNVHRLIDLMAECAERRATHWRQVANGGGTLNITQEMSDFALELILRTIFGPDYEQSIVRDGNNPFAFLSRDSTRDLRVVMQLRELRELLLQIIAARRESTSASYYDFLSIYLTATDKQGKQFSNDELLDELMTLIVAGYETSAGTLNWAWYLLAKHPDAEQKLLAEALRLVGTGGAPDQQALADMVYCQQLLEETLRLYPPVWLFTRRADEDDQLTHYDVPAGTDIYLSPYVLHRTHEYWPEPDIFRPERFADDSQRKKGDRPYFPFSLGPRRCLGEYFSFLEMKVHLGLLIQKFHMTLATDEEPALELGINLRTQKDIYLRPNLRDSH